MDNLKIFLVVIFSRLRICKIVQCWCKSQYSFIVPNIVILSFEKVSVDNRTIEERFQRENTKVGISELVVCEDF